MFIIGEPFGDDKTWFIDDGTGWLDDENTQLSGVWWEAPEQEASWTPEDEIS